MALGILIAQTRGVKLPAGYFEGLGSFGCVVRAKKWGPDLYRTLNEWSPDVIMLQHEHTDDLPQPYLDALRQHPAAAYATTGLVVGDDATVSPDAEDPLFLVNGYEFADYLRFFAHIKQRLDRFNPLLLANPLACGDLILDPQERSVQVTAQSIQLSRKAFSVLDYLARRPGRTFNRHQLLSALWADVYDPDQRTVDVVVMRIRKMLARLGAEHMIRTVHNEGYRLSSTIRPRARISAPGPVANPHSFGASPSWPVCPVFNA